MSLEKRFGTRSLATNDPLQAMGLKSGEAAADVRLQSSTESSKLEDVFGVFLPFQQKKALNQTCWQKALALFLFDVLHSSVLEPKWYQPWSARPSFVGG